MIKRVLILLTFSMLCLSCFFKENNDYADDLRMMSKTDFAKKYYTLYNEEPVNFYAVKKNTAYYTLGNNMTFHIAVFSEDRNVYGTGALPVSILTEPIAPMKLYSRSYFEIKGDILKIESVAASPGSVYTTIEQGLIKGDTIYMKEEYKATGIKNKHPLSNKYTLMENVTVFKFGNDLYIERKK